MITSFNITNKVQTIINEFNYFIWSNPANISCSKSTIETLEKDVKYVQSSSSVSIVGFEQVNLSWKYYYQEYVIRQ